MDKYKDIVDLLKNKLYLEEDAIKEKIEKLDFYMKNIIEKNKNVNLTNITDENIFIEKHYRDSLAIIDIKEYEEALNIIDIGTGAGFPGIPLAIVFPKKKFTLLDSLQKRVNIINELAKKMGLNNVIAIHKRAEELAREEEYRENFDIAISRAVANLSTLVEISLPFVKVNGYMLAYKGKEAENEIEKADYAISELGGKVFDIYENDKTINMENHKIISIKKINKTVEKYPRRAGIPNKKPITKK